MEITLLTVVYAGLQTALGYRGRVRHLLVCPIRPDRGIFQTFKHAKKTTAAGPGHRPALFQPDITWNDKPALLQQARRVLRVLA
jgi:hypothetical protein